jgi:hypothetical protein
MFPCFGLSLFWRKTIMAKKAFSGWRGGGGAAVLLGALLLAFLTTQNSLPADAEEKAAALPSDLAKIPSDAFFLVSGRIAELWNSEVNKPVRQKLAKHMDEGAKEFEKKYGLSLDEVERMTVVFMDPPHGGVEPLFFVRTTKPYERAKVIEAGKAKEQPYKGQTLFVGEKDWAVYPLDAQALVYGGVASIHGLIDHPAPKTEGNLADALKLASGKHSMVFGVNVKAFNEAVGAQLPGEVEPFKPLLEALYSTLTFDVGTETRAEVKLTFASEKDAQAAVKPARTGLDLARAGVERGVEELSKEKEMSQFVELLKQLQESLKAVQVEQKGKTLQAAVQHKIDVANVGVVLMEAVQKVREAAARAQSQNNLKQLGLAMHNYHDANGRFPPQATYNKNGKPLLSWRVLILPYIDQENLYKQFHLDEPWDSEHNKKLLAVMPKTYASPQDEKTVQEHLTHFQGFVGKGTIFEGKQGVQIASITDGTSNTIMFAEAEKAVPWTKPEDIPFDPAKPLPKLGLPDTSGFQAALCDGSVHMISHKIKPETLRNLIMRNDGNPIGQDF